MRFDSAPGRAVRFSLHSATVRTVVERVRGCDGTPASEREARLDGTLFPALRSELPAGCAEVELVYQAENASRIPLLVPEEGLAPDGAVTLEVRSGSRLRGRTFPRLSWQGDGIGRRRLRQVPAVVILPVDRPSIAPEATGPAGSTGPGFGWTLWGFLAGATLFLVGFFLWARATAEREGRSAGLGARSFDG
jgi:hypothetical protein